MTIGGILKYKQGHLSSSMVERLYSSLTRSIRGNDNVTDDMIAIGIHSGFESAKNVDNMFHQELQKKKFLSTFVTYSRNVEDEEKNHADSVVDTCEEPADHPFRHRVDELHRELKEDRAAGVGQCRGQHRRHVQLGQAERDGPEAQEAHPHPAADGAGHQDSQDQLHPPTNPAKWGPY